jgi:hypothetical protein
MAKEQKQLTREEILKSDPFYSPDTNLDLSGFPGLERNIEAEEFEAEDRFGFNKVAVTGTNKLKEFTKTLDLDTVTEIAKTTRNPRLINAVKEDTALDAAKEFMRMNPDYVKCDENYEALMEYLQEKDLQMTLDNLTKAYKSLLAEGALYVPAGKPRELSKSQLLEVQRYARAGSRELTEFGESDSINHAIGIYLKYAIGEEVLEEFNSVFDILADPKYRNTSDKAVLFVWENGRNDYQPTAERRKFFQRFSAGRPFDIALLNAAWRACEKYEQDAKRSTLLREVEKESATLEMSFDDLPDNEIESLKDRALKEHARQVIAQKRKAFIS